MATQKYQGFLEDLIPILKDEVKRVKDGKDEGDYTAGLLHEHYHTLLLLQQLSIEINLPLGSIGLTDILEPSHQYGEVPPAINPSAFKKLIQELVKNLKQKAVHLKQKKTKNDLFQQGQLQAFYTILSIMQEQAELSFDIELKEIGLEQVELSDYM
ncbi:MAG: hypothetical protein J5I98_26530 [Phaeodactylibacter sp.]|nr:hypothetical protein [Phaeodactylibacter sp.]